jgi:hypothetical protein
VVFNGAPADASQGFPYVFSAANLHTGEDRLAFGRTQAQTSLTLQGLLTTLRLHPTTGDWSLVSGTGSGLTPGRLYIQSGTNQAEWVVDQYASMGNRLKIGAIGASPFGSLDIAASASSLTYPMVTLRNPGGVNFANCYDSTVSLIAEWLPDGSLRPARVAAGSAINRSLREDSSSGKLVWRDSGGADHDLY